MNPDHNVDEPRYLQLLRTLINRSTVSGNISAQQRLMDDAVVFATELAPGITVQRGDGDLPWTLLGTSSSKNPVLFVCHCDTVPTGDEQAWHGSPFDAAITGDHIHGRGTVDMKGALALAVDLLVVAEEEGFDVAVLLTSEEEVGLIGAKAAAPELPALSPALVIVPEATENTISRGHRGVAWVKVTATGQAGHASKPDQGVNAISILSEVVIAALQFYPALTDDYLGKETINLGTISGGQSPNMIPDQASLVLDIRTIGPVSRLIEWITHRAYDTGYASRISTDIITDNPALPATDLPQFLNRFSLADPVSYATDASALRDVLGDAPVVIWGPGGKDQMHTIDETMDLHSLDRAHREYREVIEELSA